jgi:nucleoside-diphosphate-sugar epimerase
MVLATPAPNQSGGAQPARLRILVTGGSGVLGRAVVPYLRAAGHHVAAPPPADLDLFDARAVRAALAGTDAVMHLATRIPPPDRRREPGAWEENDRLRSVATQLLVDAALAGTTQVLVQPSVAWLDPEMPRPELASALDAERETERFAAAGRRGVVVRLGLLHGPGTGLRRADAPPELALAAVDAGQALCAALSVPAGIYLVTGGSTLRAVNRWRPHP